MRTLYFDTLCGASGDMILASLIDLGIPIKYLRDQLDRLALPGVRIDIEKSTRAGVNATGMIIDLPEEQTYRHLPQILDIIADAGFSEKVQRDSRRILTALGEAEAAVHGVPLEKVHFHEVGAADTIIDVAGACLCMEYLEIDETAFSELTVGHGTVACAHGIMPVPAPATAVLLKGLAVRPLDIAGEILTPTGCAVLTTLGRQLTAMPSGKIGGTGYGHGRKQLDRYPNILRAFLIESREGVVTPAEKIAVLESDMDHVSGEIMAYAAQRLFDVGALDVSWCPLFMKKGRPGYRLTVMARPETVSELADTIFAETRTLGIRTRTTERLTMARSSRAERLGDDPVEVKECRHKHLSFSKAEFDSLASIAGRTGKPLIDVMETFGLMSRSGKDRQR